MKITFENLQQAIAALRQCAKENNGRQTDTGAIRVTDLCNDVADYLQRLADDKKHNIWLIDIQLENVVCIRKFPQDCLPTDMDERLKFAEERQKEAGWDLMEDLLMSGIVETSANIDPDGTMVVMAETFVGVKNGQDIEEMIREGRDYEKFSR